jgi:hypothetical protein
VRAKMLSASTANSVLQKFTGLHIKTSASTLAEVDYDAILALCNKA